METPFNTAPFSNTAPFTDENEKGACEPTPAPFAAPTSLDLEALESMLAEAEQRGYDRARAEIASAQWNSPTVGEQPGAAPTEVKEEPFLMHRRRSVWD